MDEVKSKANCFKKRTFLTEEVAKKYQKKARKRKRKYNYYKCPHCRMWHFTTQGIK